MNGTTADGAERTAETMRYVEISYQIILFLVGTPANLWCLHKIIPNLRRSGGRFGVAESWTLHLNLHLVIADLIILIGYCLGKTAWLLNFSWPAGSAGCAVFHFGSTFAYHLWSNVAATTALDMWYCIRFPLKSRMVGAGRIKLWLGLAWAASAVLASPQLQLWGTVLIPADVAPGGRADLHQCVFRSDKVLWFPSITFAYQIYHVVGVFYAPLALILLAYAGIAYIIFWQLGKGFSIPRPSASGRGSRFRRGVARQESMETTDSSVGPVESGEGLRVHRRGMDGLVAKPRASPRIRLLKLGSVVILTYVLTWLPYQVIAALRIGCGQSLLPDGRWDPAWDACMGGLYSLEWLEGVMIAGACLNPLIFWLKHRLTAHRRSSRAFRSRSHTLDTLPPQPSTALITTAL